ncbi:hypothetical protein CNE_2c10700 [Cupriavidus necator N-1]|uniref:Uncharacterized protein n=1 Tax=Cupriavidus necator (strain ATCC 43291 / DSM 13513 / CCUG 52238 / LMG 8453 / N-1) TaxID=1042878 RepID=F8GTT0_CUPNN|nr:hypothetical protein CNE_2c10700 [Cupriavidus necator N-1]
MRARAAGAGAEGERGLPRHRHHAAPACGQGMRGDRAHHREQFPGGVPLNASTP